jgi:DNA-binding CsgD family transcriptional regulator
VATVERLCTTMYRTLRVRNRAQALGLVGNSEPRSRLSPAGLTRRQVEILRLAGAGLTNADIGSCLHLSVATVERHCTTMYRTLGVRNRAQALALLGYAPIGSAAYPAMKDRRT